MLAHGKDEPSEFRSSYARTGPLPRGEGGICVDRAALDQRQRTSARANTVKLLPKALGSYISHKHGMSERVCAATVPVYRDLRSLRPGRGWLRRGEHSQHPPSRTITTFQRLELPVSSSSSVAMQTQFRAADGLSIRCAEGGEHDDQTILLLNPWPESLYAFDSIWQQLSEHSHLFAVDLPGFGQSERKDELLSPQAMGDFIIRLVEEWSLDSPHVIGPDIGTPASLLAAAQHPGALRSLVVGTGATAYPLRVTGALKDLIDAPDLETFRVADPRSIVGGALDGIEGHELPDEIREDYLESYEGDRFVESIRYVRTYPQELPVLQRLLADIETPVQVIAGRRDTLVPPINAELLHENLPKSKLDILEAGHYIWEERAGEYASIISAWVTDGYQAFGA
jgi:pimeloyl-ACP methyl ester carboxylesterase